MFLTRKLFGPRGILVIDGPHSTLKIWFFILLKKKKVLCYLKNKTDTIVNERTWKEIQMTHYNLLY